MSGHRHVQSQSSSSATPTCLCACLPFPGHLRITFSRSSAPLSLARRYSNRASYRAVTSARRVRISTSSASIALISSSSFMMRLLCILAVGDSVSLPAPVHLESSVTERRCPIGGLSASATVARGRCAELFVRFTLELLASPSCDDRPDRVPIPGLPRDDMDDIDPLRLTDLCWDPSVAEDGTGGIRRSDGDRFME